MLVEHLVKALRKSPDLVRCAEDDPSVEVAALHVPHSLRQSFQPAQHNPVNEESGE